MGFVMLMAASTASSSSGKRGRGRLRLGLFVVFGRQQALRSGPMHCRRSSNRSTDELILVAPSVVLVVAVRLSPRHSDAVRLQVLDEVARERQHRAGDRVLPQARVPPLEAARRQLGKRERLEYAIGRARALG
eukprot:scaffold3138_cov60-Phaeocystis_antarctica.AAC.3